MPMLGIHDLALFVASGLLLNLTPGPDTLLIMARSAAQGWRAGSAAALGICTGVFVHVLAAALGLSALLAASATAFAMVKYAGAAYLICVGLGLIWRQDRQAQPAARAGALAGALPYRTIYRHGFFTNVLNPKVALFFLAFVPQFILPESPNKALAFVVLGCLFNFNSLLWCHLVALTTARASRGIRLSRRVTRWLNRLVGGLFVAFGLRLLLDKT